MIDLREAVGSGCEIKPLDAMINHNTTEVFFDNCRIPADLLIGEEAWFRYILDGVNAERILIAGESIGDARYFTKKAVDYSNERVVLDGRSAATKVSNSRSRPLMRNSKRPI